MIIHSLRDLLERHPKLRADVLLAPLLKQVRAAGDSRSGRPPCPALTLPQMEMQSYSSDEFALLATIVQHKVWRLHPRSRVSQPLTAPAAPARDPVCPSPSTTAQRWDC